jgi:hypothetical protein
MPIRCTTDLKGLELLFDRILNVFDEELRNALSYLGEQCVVRIRERSADDSWRDVTGNLRSSIGYAVIDHGRKVIESSFESVLSGSTGSANGRKYVESLTSKYVDTLALVVVAGMSYASYVEAIESKDVLASTELWARGEVDKVLKAASQKAIKRINTMKI